MSQHTKWTMLKDGLGFHIYQEPLTGESYPICVVGHHAPNPEASAYLIASAPDLLAALKDCVGRLEAYYGEQYPAVVNGKAVIRRAEEGG